MPNSSNIIYANAPSFSPCVGIRTCSDYSPFVVELVGSTVSNFGYRFGYQGSEKDNELKDDGNSYTTEFSQLDSFAMKYPPNQDFTKIIMEYLGYTLMKPYGQNNSETSYFECQKTYDNVKNLSWSS